GSGLPGRNRRQARYRWSCRRLQGGLHVVGRRRSGVRRNASPAAASLARGAGGRDDRGVYIRSGGAGVRTGRQGRLAKTGRGEEPQSLFTRIAAGARPFFADDGQTPREDSWRIGQPAGRVVAIDESYSARRFECPAARRIGNGQGIV